MELIEKADEWQEQFNAWLARNGPASADALAGYPFIKNERSPFTPARRALPMLNLALISSAGAYIDGTDGFDTTASGGDLSFREIPADVTAADVRFAARGYDPAHVLKDMNAQVPLDRLKEFEANGIIGRLNPVWFSFSGFITDAATFAGRTLPRLAERVQRYDVQAVLLVPASRLCHQSTALAARAIESVGIPTMMLAVEKDVAEMAMPPRTALHDGNLGSVAGEPNWPQHQRRVLDEALRWIEPIDAPTVRRLVVELESEVEMARGER